MVIKTPTKFFITSGRSEGFTPLNAVDGALLNAGIGNTNLVKVSSICPPYAQEIDSITIPHGSLVPAAYASITSSNPGEIISAGVAIALPEDKEHAGLIMEYSSKGNKNEIEEMVKRMAEEGMMIRGKGIRDMKVQAVEHRVEKCGCVFAAVVLWD